MLSIALTGGIGSGKTTVARIFEVLGIPVYYADEEAKRLMNEDPLLKDQLKAAFGADVYTDGILNRKKLSDLVFRNPEKLSQLNAIVHPATGIHSMAWMKHQTTPYAIKEAALIFEAGIQDQFDYVIGVTAGEPLRIARVMSRDGSSKEKVMERVGNQWPDAEKMERCDFVIINDESSALIPQVLAIHRQLLMSASPAQS